MAENSDGVFKQYSRDSIIFTDNGRNIIQEAEKLDGKANFSNKPIVDHVDEDDFNVPSEKKAILIMEIDGCLDFPEKVIARVISKKYNSKYLGNDYNTEGASHPEVTRRWYEFSVIFENNETGLKKAINILLKVKEDLFRAFEVYQENEQKKIKIEEKRILKQAGLL